MAPIEEDVFKSITIFYHKQTQTTDATYLIAWHSGQSSERDVDGLPVVWLAVTPEDKPLLWTGIFIVGLFEDNNVDCSCCINRAFSVLFTDTGTCWFEESWSCSWLIIRWCIGVVLSCTIGEKVGGWCCCVGICEEGWEGCNGEIPWGEGETVVGVKIDGGIVRSLLVVEIGVGEGNERIYDCCIDER